MIRDSKNRRNLEKKSARWRIFRLWAKDEISSMTKDEILSINERRIFVCKRKTKFPWIWFFNSFFWSCQPHFYSSLSGGNLFRNSFTMPICACVCVYALHRAPFQNAIKMKTFNKGPGESNLFQNIQKWISTTSTYTNICYFYLKVYHRHIHLVQTAVTLQ